MGRYGDSSARSARIARALVVGGLLAVLAGCSDESVAPFVPPTTAPTLPELLPPCGHSGPDVECFEAGLPDDRPEPGPTGPPQAGVPADACGEGFSHDGEGCVADIDPDDCPPGELAHPASPSCAPVAPCGSEPWGDVASGPNDLYVLASAADGGDGSATAPFNRIASAVAAASDGDVIVIGSGTYTEDIVVDRAIALRGRCPALVTIEATDIGVLVTAAAELSGFAITGGERALRVEATAQIDRLWIHDTEAGIRIDGNDVAIRDTLLENTGGNGILVRGSNTTIERSVVRGNIAVPWQGDVATEALFVNQGASATVRQSVFSNTEHTALVVYDSELVLEDSVVRGTTHASEKYLDGYGLLVGNSHAAFVTVRRSVFTENTLAGIAVASGRVYLEDTTIGDTQVDFDAAGLLLFDVNEVTSEAEVVRSTLRDNFHRGVMMEGGSARMTDTLVARSLTSDVEPGAGIMMAAPLEGSLPQLELDGCRIEGIEGAGIVMYTGQATVRESEIADTNGLATWVTPLGVSLLRFEDWPAPSALFEHVLIENVVGGVVVVGGGSAELRASVIRNMTQTPADEGMGAVSVGTGDDGVPSSLVFDGCDVLDTVSGGVASNKGGRLEVYATHVARVHPWETSDRVLALGRGCVQIDASEGAAQIVEHSLLEDCYRVGIAMTGTTNITSTHVRNIVSGDDEAAICVLLRNHGPRPLMNLSESVIEDCQYAGISASDSDLVVDRSYVANVAESFGAYGRCINAQLGSTLTLTRSQIGDCQETAVLFLGSEGSVSDSVISGVRANTAGIWGDGISSGGNSPGVSVTRTLVSGAAHSGISSYGPSMLLSDNRLQCNTFDLTMGPGGSLQDAGGNACGCGDDAVECAAQAIDVGAPQPLPDP